MLNFRQATRNRKVTNLRYISFPHTFPSHLFPFNYYYVFVCVCAYVCMWEWLHLLTQQQVIQIRHNLHIKFMYLEQQTRWWRWLHFGAQSFTFYIENTWCTHTYKQTVDQLVRIYTWKLMKNQIVQMLFSYWNLKMENHNDKHLNSICCAQGSVKIDCFLVAELQLNYATKPLYILKSCITKYR